MTMQSLSPPSRTPGLASLLSSVSISYARVAQDEPTSERYDDDDSDLDDDVIPRFDSLRQKTTMQDKISRIKEGKSKQALSKKKKIKSNTSLKDWWIWYWQKPRARFPFLYFIVILLSCLPLSIYWFMDNDSSFILCGIIGLSMFIYATNKFRRSMQLKREMDKYKSLNFEFKRENRALSATVKRFENAYNTLKDAKSRLTKANNKNRQNLKKFEQVQDNMRVVGKHTATKLTSVNKRSAQIRQNWRLQMLDNERAMLHAVFTRYETTHGNLTDPSMGEGDFQKFKEMLPKRYQKRFDKMGTFHSFAGNSKYIDQNDFAATLDTFALMETDNEDIEFIVTPMIGTPDVASFRVTTRDEWGNVYSPERSASGRSSSGRSSSGRSASGRSASNRSGLYSIHE